jgi:acetyl-CoA synthetase
VYAYITLMDGARPDAAMKKALSAAVRAQIGAFAVPDVLHWAPALPKTRSGKIMRRVLRKIAMGAFDELGDVSALADPSVVDTLIAYKGK